VGAWFHWLTQRHGWYAYLAFLGIGLLMTAVLSAKDYETCRGRLTAGSFGVALLLVAGIAGISTSSSDRAVPRTGHPRATSEEPSSARARSAAHPKRESPAMLWTLTGWAVGITLLYPLLISFEWVADHAGLYGPSRRHAG
jgi:hypothetical protein